MPMNENPTYSDYSIGRYTYGEPRVLKWGNESTLRIGSFCSIASGVTILLDGNHRVDWLTTYPFSVVFEEFTNIEGHPATKGDVIIGNDVWIAMNSLILSGVKIGDGAVIGANSVVCRDVPPYTIVAGNPAKKIKTRFDSHTVEKLLEMEWWNWDLNKIKSNVPLLMSDDFNQFISKNNSSCD
ncbi:chloramphenicol acetyltransferase [Geminocystis sp. NIES-3708]|nr:chloramphenicol acetyltransferase [Geminocystis sp. NIES-3708]